MQQPRPRRIAIVGAGPSGLFAVQSLVGQDQLPVEVDLYDRLPTPYGLLRYGVAPDHQNIKAVAAALAKTFENDAVRFLGNVELGRNVTREELLDAYDAVVYAVGASEDLHMGVPGEALPGSRSAREFVEWYSAHPDARVQSLDGGHRRARPSGSATSRSTSPGSSPRRRPPWSRPTCPTRCSRSWPGIPSATSGSSRGAGPSTPPSPPSSCARW